MEKRSREDKGKENTSEEWMNETVEQLAEVMPFSYIAIKVKKESFKDEVWITVHDISINFSNVYHKIQKGI